MKGSNPKQKRRMESKSKSAQRSLRWKYEISGLGGLKLRRVN
jgi:hypothetical protein